MQRHGTMALQPQAVADAPAPAPTVTVSTPPPASAHTPPAVLRTAQYPHIIGELRRIGILAGIIIVILIVLALVLS